MMCALKGKSKGSYTIEAVIVMSSILMAIFAVFYSFMLMYQNVVIMYAASYGAQQGAAAWVNTGRDIDGKTMEYKNNELYERLGEAFGGGGNQQAKKDKIKACVRQKLKMGIYDVDKININVTTEGNILQRKVIVEVSQTVPIPFSGIVAYFSGNEFSLHSKASSVIADPTEYIRNIDYIKEWAQKGIEAFKKTAPGKSISDAIGAITSWGKG